MSQDFKSEVDNLKGIEDLATALAPHIGKYAGYAAVIVDCIDAGIDDDETVEFITEDGRRWICVSYKDWYKNHFNYLSPKIVGAIVRKLEAVGIIVTTYYSDARNIGFIASISHFHPRDRTKLYTIDYDALEQLLNDGKFSLKLLI